MYYLSTKHLSIYQTQICKGIAILFIVLHNVLAKLDTRALYNEMSFDGNRVWRALTIVQNDPQDFFNVFMSFLGHYGVQVFTFLSAYGLMRSIANQPDTWYALVFKKIKQLLLPMILVMLLYLLLDYYFKGTFNARLGAHGYLEVLYRMLFISNFMPKQAFLVIGPWWFLSMIMQFYCLFLLMHRMQLRWGNASLAIISLLSMMISMQYFSWFTRHDLFLNATVLGHIPEFALGMYVASLDKIKIPLWLILVSFFGLFLGNIYKFFWYFAPVCSIVVIMSLCAILFKYLRENNFMLRALEYVGVLSMYIFLLNGIIREPFIPLAKAAHDPVIAIGYASIVFMICLVTAQVFYLLEGYLKRIPFAPKK
jgi:peptidoglycan/LPS O-acetylase OafA/YrhL